MNLCFFGGAVFSMSFLMFILLQNEEFFLNHRTNNQHKSVSKVYWAIWKDVKEHVPFYRFTMTCNLILFGAAGCIAVFRKYEINYLHIFGIDNRYNIQEYKMAAIAMIFTGLWFICFYSYALALIVEMYTYDAHDIHGKHDSSGYVFESTYDWVALVFLIFLVILCFNPCFFVKTARKELGYTLLQIFMAPFGKVRFRDFFFTDVLTSIGHPLADIGFIGLHFGNF